ncbi:hypothetical protein [Methylobacterium variabile]|uniref:hypothetical protein n=1 Tax=Methylobacterium variabile TaxID=298794 RepID=UPI000B283389|nr:hypothetical protein [Methylobacterium variabile]
MSGGLGIPLIDFSDVRQAIGGLAKLGQREEAQRLYGQMLDANMAAQGQQSQPLSSLGSVVPATGVPGAAGVAAGALPAGRLPTFAGGSPGAMAMPSGVGGDAEKKFVDALKGGGLTNPYGLAAVAAYASRESGYKGSNINGSWSDPSESGQPGTSGGILSWRGDRLANMRKFTAGAPDPVTAQAQFMLSENPRLTQALQNAGSAEEANRLMANAWQFAGYNRPGGENAARLNATRAYLARLNGGGFDAAPSGAPAITQVAGAGGPIVSGTNPARPPMRLPAAAVTGAAAAQAAPAADMPAPGAQPVGGYAIPGGGQIIPSSPSGEFSPGTVASPPVAQAGAASATALAPAAAQRLTPAQAQNLRAMLANPLTQGYATKIIEGLNKPSEFSFQVVGDQLIRTSKDGRAEVVPGINKPPSFSVVKGSDGNDYVLNPQTGALTRAVAGRDTTVRTITDPGERASLGLGDYKGPVQVDADGKLLAPFRPTTEVNVNQGAEKAQAAKIGGAYGDTFNDLQKGGRDAAGQLNTFRLMEKLIESPNFYSGAGGNTILAFRRAASALGISGADTAAPQELFAKLANQSVLDKLGGNLGSGVSNSDVNFMAATTANLGNTPEGNRQIIRFGKALAERQVEVAKLAREYAKGNNGLLDAGFDDRLAAYARANPLFPEATEAQQAATRPASGASPRAPAQGAPTPASPSTGGPRQGATATNPSTSERLIFDNGKWVPFT